MARTKMMPRAFAVLVGGTAFAFAACSSDAETVSTHPIGANADGELKVVGEDVDFDSDAYRASAGPIDIVYENEGSIVHTLVIDGVDDFKLTVNSRGDVDRGSVELEPGTYDMYCDVPGHRQAGMEATLEVG
jgi:plastocyanin